MTAAVSAVRDFRPFRSPNDKTRTLPNNQKCYEEDEEEGLVDERPYRSNQRSDRTRNANSIPSNHSRKRPRSLPPQDNLRHSPHRQQQQEPKSEPWKSHQKSRFQTEDYSSSPSHNHRERGKSIQSATPNQPTSRLYDRKNGNCDRDAMCNTPFRRNGAAPHRSRNNNHYSEFRDPSKDQYNGYNQGANASRQQHRWQDRDEAAFRSDNRGEAHCRANDRGGYNRNLPARNEGGSGYRRSWDDRRLEDRKDWGDRRPGERGDYSGSRPGNRREWNERLPRKEFDRNHSNQYHGQQVPLREPCDDRKDNGRQDWRTRDDQASRHNGRFNDYSTRHQSRLSQERLPCGADPPRHQDDYYRYEPQDRGFHQSRPSNWDESYSNSQMQTRPSMNSQSRPKRLGDRYFEEHNRACNDFRNNGDQRPPFASSPQARECSQTGQVHDYRRSYTTGNASPERHQSRGEYQENMKRSRHERDLHGKRNCGFENGHFIDSNPPTNRIDIQPQQGSEKGNGRYEYTDSNVNQTPLVHVTSLEYNVSPTKTKVVGERTVKSNTPKSWTVSKAKEPGTPRKTRPDASSQGNRSLLSRTTSKPPPVAEKPVEESKKIETNKSTLAIPMSWLKPKAKPKPKKPIQKTVAKGGNNNEGNKDHEMVEAARVPRAKTEKGSALTVSPSQSPSVNRMVTDSEGGSTLSNMKDIIGEWTERNRSKPKVPSAIVTKSPASSKVESADDEMLKSDNDSSVDDTTNDSKAPSVLQASTYSSNDSINSPPSDNSDDSDTDDEEVMMWGSKMFGVPFRPTGSSSPGHGGGEEEHSPMKKLRLKLKVPRPKPGGDAKDEERPKKKKKSKKPKRKRGTDSITQSDKDDATLPLKKRKRKSKKRDLIGSDSVTQEEAEEERMRKESAKPLTAEQIKAILGEDDFAAPGGSNWVRRSVRQPSKALLDAKPLRMLVEKLKCNDPDMVVLKMKKYINDPNAPSVVLDAALDALEENTNCQTLYIQNFNEGMRDNQVLHLLRILQNPKCKIWCLNIGENYNVKTRTWDKFTKGLKKTKITHMYASEHTITTEMKDEIRTTIRNNRAKHDMHINPDNLHIIVQCTHCWWNPINAKVLRPYLKKEGFEHILTDKEAQGLRGSSSAAPSG